VTGGRKIEHRIKKTRTFPLYLQRVGKQSLHFFTTYTAMNNFLTGKFTEP
jgi:hypothetical protein